MKAEVVRMGGDEGGVCDYGQKMKAEVVRMGGRSWGVCEDGRRMMGMW